MEGARLPPPAPWIANYDDFYKVRYRGNDFGTQFFLGSKKVAVVTYSINNKAPLTIPYIIYNLPQQIIDEYYSLVGGRGGGFYCTRVMCMHVYVIMCVATVSSRYGPEAHAGTAH